MVELKINNLSLEDQVHANFYYCLKVFFKVFDMSQSKSG